MQIADWTMIMVSGAHRPEGRPDELLGRGDFEPLFFGAAGAQTSQGEGAR
jgi:hypothetical protein